MHIPLTLLILFCTFYTVEAQTVDTVRHVVSEDYRSLLSGANQSNVPAPGDSASNISKSNLLSPVLGNVWGVKRLGISGNSINLQKAHRIVLNVGGSYTTTVEMKRLNRLPDVQQQYVQGRSINGNIVWQGPETNEMFSFGPPLAEMEFDGTAYSYDLNGKLVKGNTGRNRAIAYGSPLLRNGLMASHAISLSGSLVKDGRPQIAIAIKAAENNEKTLVAHNNNHGERFSVSATATKQQIAFSADYSYTKNKFTYTNRNGFLNRVYMNSLLTPVSFDNTQGTQLPTGQQRSYSLYADNPFFLLQQESPTVTADHNFSLILEKKGKLNLQVSQSLNKTTESTSQLYPPGTAFFPSGTAMNRTRNNSTYNLAAATSYLIDYNSYGTFTSAVTQRYILCDADATIDYRNAKHYSYQRTAHEFIFLYASTWRPRNHHFFYNLDIGNKAYLSNTTRKGTAFLPGISARINGYDFLDCRRLNVKLITTLDNFNAESSLNTATNTALLLQFNTADAATYFPTEELETYRHMNPIRNKEFTVRVEAEYAFQYRMQARLFIRNTAGDVFPSVANGTLQLSNLADHRTRGFEIQLDKTCRYNAKPGWNASLSFLTYRSTVTNVNNKDQVAAIAGFADVYKAVVKGKPLGVIVGSSYLRNNNGQRMIGQDGFPLVGDSKSVIGDPTPDFIMKWSNMFYWKRFQISADLEWRQGGDIWNGTQAVLDYYGRSASSAQLRNLQSFVFDGVMPDGSKNVTPVSFYDPAKPFRENRWVRYGFAGVAEDYIAKADQLRCSKLSVSYQVPVKKYLRQVNITCYVSNIILWKANKNTNVNQLMYDMPGTEGLDFFNLPSATSYAVNLSLQF